MNRILKLASRLLRLDVRNEAVDYGNFTSWFSPSNIFDRLRASTLADNETIFSAVSRLSNTLASLPLKLHGPDYQPVNIPVSDLITNAPNPNMHSFEFFHSLEARKNTAGNGYAIKEYNNQYQVKALWLLDSAKVEPVIEATTRELWYQVQGDTYDPLTKKGLYYVHNLDMIHVKHIYISGNSKGVSPLDVLSSTVDFQAKVKEFSLDNIDKAITASFILNLATQVKGERKTEILQHFKNFYKENGGVLLEEAGTKITPIQQKTFIDTKVFESEKITRECVASVYSMPVSMLSQTEGTSYQSLEQMSLEYITYTELPIVRQYEQELNRKLLTENDRRQGLYFKFSLSALLRGDMKTRGEFYTKMVRSGLMKPNEGRAYEEWPPEKGGDQLFISGDLYPITQERKKK